MNPDDPRSLIFSYLTELPQTIRFEAMLFVIFYATGSQARDPEKLSARRIAFRRSAAEFSNGLPEVTPSNPIEPGFSGVVGH
jgi:hypothetical protein